MPSDGCPKIFVERVAARFDEVKDLPDLRFLTTCSQAVRDNAIIGDFVIEYAKHKRILKKIASMRSGSENTRVKIKVKVRCELVASNLEKAISRANPNYAPEAASALQEIKNENQRLQYRITQSYTRKNAHADEPTEQEGERASYQVGSGWTKVGQLILDETDAWASVPLNQVNSIITKEGILKVAEHIRSYGVCSLLSVEQIMGYVTQSASDRNELVQTLLQTLPVVFIKFKKMIFSDTSSKQNAWFYSGFSLPSIINVRPRTLHYF